MRRNHDKKSFATRGAAGHERICPGFRFYTQVLGFRVAERRDDLQFVHVDCGVDGLQIGLSAGSLEVPSAGSVILNFDVAGDVAVVRASLEKKGVRFEGLTRVIAGKVRLAAFLDPDGYRLRLAGQDPA